MTNPKDVIFIIDLFFLFSFLERNFKEEYNESNTVASLASYLIAEEGKAAPTGMSRR